MSVHQTAHIFAVQVRERLDSRGVPTLEAAVVLQGGTMGRASVPSGASTGSHEAVECRDGDATRYGGKGVRAVAARITDAAHILQGMDAREQAAIDARLCEMDGTPNKSRLGANALLVLSLATARAAAAWCQVPLFRYVGGTLAHTLPIPLMNLINGGLHADNGLWVQECMIVPWGFATFSEALRAGVEVFSATKTLLKQRGLSTSVGDEGGYAPRVRSVEEALDVLVGGIESAGYQPGTQISLALDVAASTWWKEGAYHVNGQLVSAEQLVTQYQTWCANHPLVSIEDGLAEDDWVGWQHLTQTLGSRVQLVGDDLFVTQSARLQEGIRKKVANAILIKPNQVGTLTETWRTLQEAHRAGYRAVVSHRSGETDDTFVADLAVAVGAGQIKTGAPCRGERVAKYNRLLEIEETLGAAARFAGAQGFLGGMDERTDRG